MKRDPKKKKDTEIIVLTDEEIKRNQERESTIRSKKLFIDILERHRGIITMVCEKTNIARATYYYWRKTDKEFKEKVDEIINAKPEILEDIMYVEAYKGNANAAKFLLTHHYWKKTNKEKESTVHIFHHVDKQPEKKEKSITQSLWEEARRRHEQVDALKEMYRGKEFPLKPDGTPIADNEMYYYERFIRDWFKQKDLERELVEEES